MKTSWIRSLLCLLAVSLLLTCATAALAEEMDASIPELPAPEAAPGAPAEEPAKDETVVISENPAGIAVGLYETPVAGQPTILGFDSVPASVVSIAMYDEQTGTLLAVWNSEDAGVTLQYDQERDAYSWDVPYTFPMAGMNLIYFGLSTDGTSFDVDEGSHFGIFVTVEGLSVDWFQEGEDGDWYLTATGYTGSNPDLELPEGIRWIANGAFEGNTTLRSVSLPSSLAKIGQRAFLNCKNMELSDEFLPDGLLTIGARAFEGCASLQRIHVPFSVQTLEDYMFANCTSLEYFEYDSDWDNEVYLENIGTGVFKGCSSLTEVWGITAASIGDLAFANCSQLTYLDLAYVDEERLTYIADDTFQGCSSDLVIIVFPHSYAKEYCIQHGIAWDDSWWYPHVYESGQSADTVEVGETITFTAVTDPYAYYISMWGEKGNLVQRWTRDEFATEFSFTDEDENEECRLSWEIPYAFKGAGQRVLTFKAEENDKESRFGWTARVTVTSGLPAVSSVTAKPTSVEPNQDVTFTVKTPSSAKYLAMFSENGTKVKVWGMTGNSTVSGTTRIWTVKYAFSGAGTRTMTFKCSANGTYGPGKEVTINVLPAVSSVSANPTTAAMGEAVTFTVKTHSSAKSLAMFAENGAKTKEWAAANNSTVSGSTRVWTVKYAFNGPGDRTMTFKCAVSNTYGKGKSVKLTILPSVTSASVSPSTANAGEDVTFTVKTSSSAKYLAMYSESGAKVKTWNASGNSTVSGSSRVWTVKYSFASAGNRTMTFKCSINGTYGKGKSVKVAVLPVVTAVSANPTSAKAGKAITFTVKTTSSAKYLAMYSENGAKVKTWNASGNSQVSGSTRIWTVKYAFTGKGRRTMTFKCSVSGTYGPGKSVNVTIN